jgi:hypothetical protein
MSDQKCRQNGRLAGSFGRYLFSGLGTWDFGFFPFAFAGLGYGTTVYKKGFLHREM